MIDHVLGRPSVKSRRLQVLAVLSFWSVYLFRGHKHGPPLARFFSRFTTRALTTWQTVLLTMMYLYAARNFSTLVGIASPEPMSDMYSATYFRATWVLTALDAGFWTAMKIRRKWLRDIASIVFSLFYLVAAEEADEKVRKVRGMLTVEHLRISWDKGTTPYIGFFQGLLRPRYMKWPPRQMRINRPKSSDFDEQVSAWLYWDGSIEELRVCNKIILDIPGGGFVAMNPRTNDDKLFSWAVKTRIPVLSLDYKKAPEYPYPHALNECYDVYTSIILSKGKCVGLSGDTTPHVIVTGDSAGGNLATAMTLMVIESGNTPARRFAGQVELPAPIGLILFYPGLDMNIGNWMSDEQMALIQDKRDRGTNQTIMRRKSAQYNELVGTPHQSFIEGRLSPTADSVGSEEGKTVASISPPAADTNGNTGGRLGQDSSQPESPPHPEYSHAFRESWDATSPLSQSGPSKATKPAAAAAAAPNSASHHPAHLKTRLAMSSMISYFNDRVLTPEMMRAMIILYIGSHNRPDFSTDYLLSPILAPDGLLAHFPKTIFLTGERDPLVDDTVIFAGRLKRAKREAHHRRRRGRGGFGGGRYRNIHQLDTQGGYDDEQDGDGYEYDEFDEKDFVEVVLLPGVSHGFLQFPTVFPPAFGIFDRCATWMVDLFRDGEMRERELEQLQAAAAAAAAAKKEGAAGGRSEKGRDNEERKGGIGFTGGESTDDERPLEMGMTRLRKKSSAATQGGSGGDGEEEEGDDDGSGGGKSGQRRKKDEGKVGGRGMLGDVGEKEKKDAKQRRKSRVEHTAKDLNRLRSSDDLLGRRMFGLAGGLTGLREDK